MAVITAEELRDALRVGDSEEETAQVTRLHAYAQAAISKRAPDAPEVVSNEAMVRLAAYLYDQPLAPTGDGYASALRNSGAGSILGPYVVVRAR